MSLIWVENLSSDFSRIQAHGGSYRCFYGLLPGPFLLSYSVFVFSAVHKIKLAISSAFDRTLIYRITSYRLTFKVTVPMAQRPMSLPFLNSPALAIASIHFHRLYGHIMAIPLVEVYYSYYNYCAVLSFLLPFFFSFSYSLQARGRHVLITTKTQC